MSFQLKIWRQKTVLRRGWRRHEMEFVQLRFKLLSMWNANRDLRVQELNYTYQFYGLNNPVIYCTCPLTCSYISFYPNFYPIFLTATLSRSESYYTWQCKQPTKLTKQLIIHDIIPTRAPDRQRHKNSLSCTIQTRIFPEKDILRSPIKPLTRL